MSEPQTTLTYERLMALFLENREQIQQVTEQMKKTDLTVEKMSKELGRFSNRIGEIIEGMIGGESIIEQFQALGYTDLDYYCENQKFRNKKLGIKGEIDLFIENGDFAILVEVKTTLETADVRRHIKRLEEFRRCVDAKGGDKRRFIGAVAGAVINGDAAEFAQENGLYVIVQAGDSFKIVSPPDGFKVKEW